LLLQLLVLQLLLLFLLQVLLVLVQEACPVAVHKVW
jgi:hypothetical protein